MIRSVLSPAARTARRDAIIDMRRDGITRREIIVSGVGASPVYKTSRDSVRLRLAPQAVRS